MNNTDATKDIDEQEKPATVASLVWEMIKFIFIASIIIITVRVFIAQPFIVEGPSMYPTFTTGDYLIVDQLSYRLRSPVRGEIVVVRDPRTTTMFLIKRVIGLPGETISIKGGVITIENEGIGESTRFTLSEPYITSKKAGASLKKTLKDDEFFILGDNRAASLDSRFFGPVNENLVVGRALLRLFPPTKASVLPGRHLYW